MGRWVVLTAGALLAMTLGLGGCVAVVAGGGGGGGGGGAGAGSAGTGGGPAVPLSWEALDQQAAATCSGLPWTVLAAIGRVESDSGQSTAPGVHGGANAAGAEGPMQFEPATFAAYATVGPGGATPPSPYDPVDAVYTAARMLCADGGGTTTALAVDDYDHSATYVATVLVLAAALAAAPTLAATPAAALAFAAQQLGVPYVWGGETPGIGFDCSGLVQAAYRAAGVSLPRVAQAQFDAGPAVTGTPVPGDLLFFGGSAASVSHVGIYVGGGEMIDAPYTGTVVRFDAVPTTPGTPWGTEIYVGATRPWAG